MFTLHYLKAENNGRDGSFPWDRPWETRTNGNLSIYATETKEMH